MSIHVKTAAGWEELGASGGSGGSAWGDFTTNGDEHASGTYGPDAQGRMWKWAEWNVANDYSVNLSGGQYWVLCVGGGSEGVEYDTYKNAGQPGLVNEGYWEFDSGPATLKVGAKGTYAGVGSPSSVESYGTQGVVRWGSTNDGRGSQAATLTEDATGYKSFITGTEQQYAVGRNSSLTRPGKSSSRNHGTRATDGAVIIATVTNSESDWNPPGALPGLGTWATITSVWDGSGAKPNRYTYKDGIDWVAFEWTQDGSMTTQAGGLVDCFLIGGGAGINSTTNSAGQGGRVLKGVESLSVAGKVDVIIGPGGAGTGNFEAYHGKPTSVGSLVTGLAALNSGSGATDYNSQYAPMRSSITGTEQTYGAVLIDLRGGSTAGSSSGRGDAGHYTGPIQEGTDGCAIVRVPADLAAGVDPDSYNDITTFDLAKQAAKDAAKSAVKETVKNKRKKR
jgi:hypothetical protein